MNRIEQLNTRNQLGAALTFLVAGVLLVLIPAAQLPTRAQDAKNQHAHQQDMRPPQTAQEHRERAEQYRKKAGEYHQEALEHKQMLADYSKKVATNPKDPGENAYIKRMRLHCGKYVKSAEALALEAEEMAKYHTLRAKEIEGQ